MFMKLYNKKKDLLNLLTQEHNAATLDVDLGVMEELAEMRKTIQNQEYKIEKLRS